MKTLFAVLASAAAIGLVAAPSALAAGPSAHAAGVCPQFRVMHNDKIGKISFPAGPYNMVTSLLSCTESTKLFQNFLDRPSGKLPKPWKLSLLSGGRRRFTKVGTKVDFQATPASEPAPPTPGKPVLCAGTFRVLHNDQVGKMKLPAGRYSITVLNSSTMTCPTASYDFKYFLDTDYSGNLPSPWTTNVATKTFYRGSKDVGFSGKRVGS